ncbi:hypothetical protein COW36_08625 [bacterium (Candidatus Blackallbacteria) CG17_big_fil_post_rev_8_21_14_2_50_48_46]|uniref:Uncharacterized protein n=1 Tax=bacterium (Candidatus Blackallbacteria) CG17_big_fil_post_rev_8_21_14_2_50_48_46 TaxID=2014261 RepID=A0A2M7G6B0_9BACT|nr:MAG: hypothetical protein COW64_05925 [bacterium (Candidatus Blackallbacteria) CG18_big_fil_WC_8_21_14_2_50_49_26]PIW17551.1 MAG: hypothetical protein COW36_08625 [bacterium (Candidatus Blackallbacteria) CG17_big_fil_post_rev_8_21_14_2_50_48_46]PIW48406.1 MAG: hypothetical protein COW20_09975 [bacterium (Candidatus Blackallbacteria) CG13_big_fil_rev_8_21_14_2_50_49_14]
MQIQPNQNHLAQIAKTSGGSEAKATHAQIKNSENEFAQAIHAKDSHINSILPGGCVIPPETFFHSNNKSIEKTLAQASAKYPGAQRDALNSFHENIEGMTPGELDDLKDNIVKRMGSNETSQWERDILQKMYQIADAVAENRIPPHVGKPSVDPFPRIKPFPNPIEIYKKTPQPAIEPLDPGFMNKLGLED